MSLYFVKNIKNNNICNKIFINKLTSNNKYKARSKCFIKKYMEICKSLEMELLTVYESTVSILEEFKEQVLRRGDNNLVEKEVMSCLERGNVNSRVLMNSILYAGNDHT
jgi:hypothetical protein